MSSSLYHALPMTKGEGIEMNGMGMMMEGMGAKIIRMEETKGEGNEMMRRKGIHPTMPST